ncbi:FAD binding domain-containing protein [Acetobacterium bakii]|uniref:Molybdopterin dehydrogenase n=1 Tax=Acetobacterium bakii TaxID=52689 RepID=A0A0L6U471_9FIRM|nr:FAD binding domain-containing protein [Acetobacterium bakii]KNZ42595.1 molybdopterin dehydrogenase [Acetobacterium bakii]
MVNGYQARSLQEALDILSSEAVIPYSGGTDLMKKANGNATYLFLNKVPEMKNIREDRKYIRIGAGCTFTEIIESELTPAILKEAAALVAAPAIRNLGTVGGNICNGSPKADCALIFFVTDSKLRLVSKKGERVIPISEFYLGRNHTILQKDELLVEIFMNKTGFENYCYKKVGARKALTMSRVSFAAILNMADGKITQCMIAFGAVGEVILRRKEIDDMLIGRTIPEARAVKENYLAAYEQAINPVQGRISAEYKKTVCMNLLGDFLDSKGI